MGSAARILVVMCDDQLGEDESRLREDMVTPMESLLEQECVDAIVLVGLDADAPLIQKIVNMQLGQKHPLLERVYAAAAPAEVRSDELPEFARRRGFPRGTLVKTCASSSIPFTLR